MLLNKNKDNLDIAIITVYYKHIKRDKAPDIVYTKHSK